MNDNENKTNAPTIKLPDLLPCPFCGGKAEYVCSNDGDYIECTRCGLGTTRHEQGRVNSVQRWNTRNEADALRAEAEGYRAMIADAITIRLDVKGRFDVMSGTYPDSGLKYWLETRTNTVHKTALEAYGLLKT